MERFDKTDNRF